MKKNCSHDYRQCLTFVLGLAIQLSLSLNTLSSRCIFVQQRRPDILTRPFVTTPNNFRKHGGDARPFGNPREHRNGNYLSLTPMFSYLLLHEPLARPLFSYKQSVWVGTETFTIDHLSDVVYTPSSIWCGYKKSITTIAILINILFLHLWKHLTSILPGPTNNDSTRRTKVNKRKDTRCIGTSLSR